MTGILLILNLILIPRVFVLFSNRVLTLPRVLVLLSPLVAILILFEVSLLILGLVFLYCIIVFLSYNRERLNGQNDFFRILSLFVYVIVVVVTGAVWDGELRFRFELQDAAFGILNIYMFGFLFVLNEVNLIVRFVLIKLNLIPKDNEENSNSEQNAGRVIGLLERSIIYILVIFGEFTVIGIVIAAKGLSRFKKMEDRNFAEYVLIGTLCSFLSVILIFLLVKTLLA